MIDSSKNKIKAITEFNEGEILSITETLEDSQILLYLGLTKDANPLFIQTEFAEETINDAPIVPSIMLMGIISSNISKHLPGPGWNIVNLTFNLLRNVYHGETLTFHFEIINIDELKRTMTLSVKAYDYDDERLLNSVVIVELNTKEKVSDVNESTTSNN
ncbi:MULTISPECIES: MaoC/PaaZ C-terminal domain-containing protein [Enterococcaceae]|uniref:MaoC family dehydratase n=1 Tax=Enterococcaceae TaxID=81852 RepID=UPI000E540872|nr:MULTISPECIES: MaoC/PaaZ C-terminal domain-containing protein [Enterococcaceae]MCI0129771.1 MaoC family dehydratase N-terminal domain-containing protein [Vagococcus sp. CY53-2]RGI31947.1 enoyl-CoA hydratase [Melissococcus sp. OM08-11BH]UNM90498.1 MaoC family dehydratase N-terminal domain-containing protein [Vagococcus sp. CY52-2]